MVFIKSVKFRIRIFHQENGRAPFTEWAESLDKTVRGRINARIARFEDGHFGDHKAVGDNVLEARFFFGAGYRVYFAIQGEEVVLLLTGGDKSTQVRDVKQAKDFLRSYLAEVQNANKK